MKRHFLSAFFILSAFFAGSQEPDLELSIAHARKLANLPLHCIETEYPNKLNQVLTDSTFIESPIHLHPVFYGCFDWHSSVHGHWLLAKVMNRFPDSEIAATIEKLFDRQFTPEKVAAELAYFEPKLEKSFERTYGWAWLLKLYAELKSARADVDHKWTENLAPLNDFIVESYKAFLPKLVYPIRSGEHVNTAFGFSLALDYAYAVHDSGFAALLCQRSADFFMADKNCPLEWEPGGYDFISPCLQEAELMSKVLAPDKFEKWLREFLPGLFSKKFTLEPGKVVDRTDGKLVHLDGLNFSRAWCFYRLAQVLPEQKTLFMKLGDAHVKTSMDFVVDSDYMGSHWLATFLVYALEKRSEIPGVQ
ncbi:MAG: DUF2891 domain-containing protein [Bacteroidetes bacterium]|nr:DUF2891 domain-containing protein [Bacteroidota bacterium]